MDREALLARMRLRDAKAGQLAPFFILHACGHKAAFKEIPGDKNRHRRIEKERKRDCAPCRQKKHGELIQAALQLKAVKIAARKLKRAKMRICDRDTAVGCTFVLKHFARNRWRAALIDDATGDRIATIRSHSMTKAINELNQAWLQIFESAKQPAATELWSGWSI